MECNTRPISQTSRRFSKSSANDLKAWSKTSHDRSVALQNRTMQYSTWMNIDSVVSLCFLFVFFLFVVGVALLFRCCTKFLSVPRWYFCLLSSHAGPRGHDVFGWINGRFPAWQGKSFFHVLCNDGIRLGRQGFAFLKGFRGAFQMVQLW